VHLLSLQEALHKLNGSVSEGYIVDYVWRLWKNTVEKLTSKQNPSSNFSSPRGNLSRMTGLRKPLSFSAFSGPSVPNGHFCSSDFIQGAGMIVMQPSTQKIVLVYDTLLNVWFLPQGRKSVGESLEHTALKEACKEVCVAPICSVSFT
jgi:hypothetical protein